jgi:hypothetical protein
MIKTNNPLRPDAGPSAADIILTVREYSKTPGGRVRTDGKFPGNNFFDEQLLPAFVRAQEADVLLFVDLDGVAGMASSFLDETFGSLSRKFKTDAVAKRLRLISVARPFLFDKIWKKFVQNDGAISWD